MNKSKIKCLYLPCVLLAIAVILGIAAIYILIVELESFMVPTQVPEFYMPECDCTSALLKMFFVIGTWFYLLFVYIYVDKLEKECKGEKNGHG